MTHTRRRQRPPSRPRAPAHEARGRSRGARRRPERRRGSRETPATAMPSNQPTTTPATATPALSTPLRSPSCHASCAEPREPAPRLLEIAPHPAGGEHREREEERRALAPDEQEAGARDVRCSLRSAQLLDRRVDVEGRRARGQLGARALGVATRRRCPTGAAGRDRPATPRRRSGTCARAPARPRARCAPPRRRAAPAVGR